MSEAFEGIKAGLEDAIAHTRNSGGTERRLDVDRLRDEEQRGQTDSLGVHGHGGVATYVRARAKWTDGTAPFRRIGELADARQRHEEDGPTRH